LASPATCICASCNISRARGKVFTAAYGCKRLLYFEGYEDIRKAIAREKQLKGWRREKKLDLTRIINPEFKDLAQTWGWKMITAHEKMYP
jgi:putative endonuclease